MKIRKSFYLLAIVLFLLQSCGPGVRIGNKKIKKIGNIHDVTVIRKSRINYVLEKQRRKNQLKINKRHWKKQMKNRYNSKKR